MSAWHGAGLVLLMPPVIWLLLLLAYRRPALAAWREPVLGHPVLIIESDDWGPGPAQQATALRRLAECLLKYRDTTGRPPVMTLGLTLTLPDSQGIKDAFSNRHSGAGRNPEESTPWAPACAGMTNTSLASQAIADTQPPAYRALPLTALVYADILAAIQEGIAAGVFAPQLHGMAHYWPEALMRASQADPQVLAWILAGPHQETEVLPSPLQTRWVDASVLPSRPLPAEQIRAAVAEEVAFYRQVFGAAPEVAVPPTFVWTPEVEAAWAAQGVRVLVTPGRPCNGRDALGRPECAATPLHNGQRGLGDIRYLVRDRYFEPARGHRAERGLQALAEKTAQGRPCLLETHRFNFTDSGAETALAELDALLRRALAEHPTLRFVNPAELAESYRASCDRPVIRLGRRLTAWQARMREAPRFARLARLTGLECALAGCTPRTRGNAT
jgi:hypothetical protein